MKKKINKKYLRGYNHKGKRNAMFGKNHSEIAKQKMREKAKLRIGKKGSNWKGGKIKRICLICKKEFYVIPYQIKKGWGKFCSRKCQSIWKIQNKRGKNNPAWKGGITPITNQIRHSDKYKMWRQNIFIRDNFTCQECGQIGGKLEVHHIKFFRILIKEVKNYLPLLDLYDGAMTYTPLWDLDNGITLCKGCHSKMKKGKYKL